MTSNDQNYNKLDKGFGPGRNASSWTSTPDLTSLSDGVTHQIGKLKSKIYKKGLFVYYPELYCYFFIIFR
jgi:hypothetical protein